jgi:peptidoglycan-N-acetylglucosamine deacetylase
MHDAGGNRAHTVDYLENSLIPAAKAAGYTFETVPQAQPGLTGLTGPAADPHSAADHALIELVSVWLVYPNRFTGWLFVAAVLTLSMTGVGYALLALVRARLRPAPASRRPDDTGPALGVSVLIAAYNEATVIEATLRSLVTSTYPVREFVVVDDGSSDDTAQIVRRLAQTLDPRIRLIQQENGRKPAALNTGLAAVTGEVVVTVDADTRAHPTMVADLVRHFEADPYGTLGAVAGVVHVGNRRQNLLTRWQALEYLTQIGVERAAHDLLGAITIVPGACAAWRREAVLRAGGFSEDTLAEDCDLTLALHRMGWRVTQDDEARADTEAPEDVDSLLKQRVRWTYGTLQAITKHRDMVLRARYGWLGLVILPWAAISIAVPLVTMPLVAAVSVAAFTAQGPAMLGGYYLAFTAVQSLTALIAVRLLHETVATLSIAPVYRLIYEPLRAYLLTMSSYLALRGVPVGWNKLVRTGTVSRSASAAHATVPRPRRGGADVDAEVDAGKENAR